MRKHPPLTITHPSLCLEWDHEKNGNYKPENASMGMPKKVFWICKDCGLSFACEIAKRAKRGDGCGYCAGKLVSPFNSLAFKYPEIAAQWDYEKNSITPNDVIGASHIKVHWICSNEWCKMSYEQSIDSRTIGKEACSYCAGKKVCNWNSLETHYPHLAKEWDYGKNKLGPSDYTFCSKKNVHWLCSKCQMTYECTIEYRAKRKNCPYCSNSKVCHANCLATLFPELIKEWCTDLNGTLTPYDTIPGSSEKVYWKCVNKKCGFIWKVAPVSRTKYSTGCPNCRSSKGEIKIAKELIGFGVEFKRQYWFKECRDILPLRFDFYLTKYNACIEFDGSQHYTGWGWGGNAESLIGIKRRDSIKNEYCLKNKIPLLRIPYWRIEKTPNILFDFLKTLPIAQPCEVCAI